MRAIAFNEYGPADVLHVVDVEEPHAGAGQIRIQVRASSLVPGDLRVRSGVLRDVMPVTFPYRMGFDAAGIVDEVGDRVGGVAVGDEVFGYVDGDLRGANADKAVLVVWGAKPTAWTWAEAGAAAGSVETATRVLDWLGVGTGDTVLIHGASGAVGAIAVQLAVFRGATVIGTGSDRNQERLRGLGAVPVVYGPGFADRVRSLSGSTGVGAVLDCAGVDLEELVALAGTPARVVTIANMAARERGVHLSHGAPAAQAAAIGVPADPLAAHGLDAARRIDARQGLRVAVAATFPFDDVVAAAQLSDGPHSPGKVVLVN